MTSFTSASEARRTPRTLAALAIALILVVALNAWVGYRLPVLLESTHVQYFNELERRAQAVVHKDRVRVLVIGNSHALKGLIPPYLAGAMNLPSEAVFNLSLHATSPFVYRVLLPRYLALFPNTELVLCGTDLVFLSANIDLPERFVSRHVPVERWHYASRYAKDLEQGVGLAVAWPFPLADFGPVLKQQWQMSPTQTLQRLVAGTSFRQPKQARVEAIPYAWGYPVDLTVPAVPSEAPLFMPFWARRGLDYKEFSPKTERGWEELTLLAERTKARGLQMAFVRLPFDRDMEALMAKSPEYAPLQARLKERIQTLGPFVDVRPGWHGARYFLDGNHLNPTGARAAAALIGPEVARHWRKAGPAGLQMP